MKTFFILMAFLLPTFASAQGQGVEWRTDYELVIASQTDQALGTTGTAGDILERLIIVPETTAAGTVSIRDGSGGAMNVFVSGTLSDLSTIVVPVGIRSVNGGWKVTTGANVHVIAVGRFR